MTNQYIACGNAAKQLQNGSDYLTEQVRLYAMTGQSKYMDAYFEEAENLFVFAFEFGFEEAETKQSREKALDILKRYFDGTETQTARIKERVFLKMQTRHSIM